jgi:hypothetical protein
LAGTFRPGAGANTYFIPFLQSTIKTVNPIIILCNLITAKKSISLYYFTLITLIVILSSETISEKFNKGLTGRVKSITEHIYRAIPANIDGRDTLQEGEEVSIRSYQFDKDDHLTEENSFLGRIRCSYNSHGLRILEETFLDNRGPWSRTDVYKYNDENILVADTSFNGNGTSSGFCQYRYDSKGRDTEEITWNIENLNKPYSRVIYKFGVDSHYTERKLFIRGYPDSKTLYKYNAAWFITEKTDYWTDDRGEDSLVSTTISRLDEYNNMLEEITYDSKGNLIPARHYTRAYYVYDKTGNWIKYTVYNDEGVTIHRREIEYY